MDRTMAVCLPGSAASAGSASAHPSIRSSRLLGCFFRIIPTTTHLYTHAHTHTYPHTHIHTPHPNTFRGAATYRSHEMIRHHVCASSCRRSNPLYSGPPTYYTLPPCQSICLSTPTCSRTDAYPPTQHTRTLTTQAHPSCTTHWFIPFPSASSTLVPYRRTSAKVPRCTCRPFARCR